MTESVSGIRDRLRERETLNKLLQDARGGRSAVLVIRGEPGVGKSALLQAAADDSPGFQVAQVAGVESEMELPFAGLHQLCAPLLDRVDALPPPQQGALSIALGLASGDPPDRFLVALGTLTLLAEVAEDEPLLCLVDDTQWLDEASVQVLGFVARRLLAEPVAILFSTRDTNTDGELSDLPALMLEGLDEEDARSLLSTVVPGRLDERVRERIIAETRGNPLAVLELPRGLSAMELAGGFGVPDLSLAGRIEERFVQRLQDLPSETQLLLLVAAAEPIGDPALMWRAASHLGIPSSALEPAERAGLMEVRARVHFRHPLLRSAVYRSASADDRRTAHSALADVTDAALEPDRRAWHRAQATQGPDEGVAAELERSAARARARGGFAAAAAFLQRAVALTQDSGRRAVRALAAAQAAFQAGAPDEALRLVGTAEAAPLDEVQRAEADLVRGQVAFASDLSSQAPSLLLRAARRLEQFDLERARETYLAAWGAATVAPGDLAGGGVLPEISRSILDLPPRPGAPRPIDLLLTGLARLTTDGRAAATPALQRAADVLRDIPLEDVLRWGWMAPAASNAVWDNDGAYAISARQVKLLRDAGAPAQLPLHLSGLGLARAWTGDLAGAASNMAEADSLAAAMGGESMPWIALRLRALQGRETEAAAAIETAIDQASAGADNLAMYAHWAAAVLYNGLARFEEAAASAREASSNAFEYWVSVWVLPELVEAAARVQDAATAGDALERLAETTQPSDNDLALGIEARCRALLNNGATAEQLYQDAIERLDRTRLRPELARAHLLYGEWLRREARRVDARAQLRASLDLFETIGMEAFAERARGELLATGEKVRKRTVTTRDELTPQERRVARMAGDGLSNPEIAAQLFLSRRTVEWHLHKVFTKLDISSRKELRTYLPDSGRGTIPA